MEKSILKALWFGQINPWEETVQETEESLALRSQMEVCREKLCQVLTDEGLQLLEQYDRFQNDSLSNAEVNGFMTGFRLGAQIMLEIKEREKI